MQAKSLRKRTALIIISIISILIILGGTLALYPSIVSGQPPQVIMRSAGRQYVGAQGSYCWASFSMARCVDYIAPSNRTDLPLPISLPAGSSASFDVLGYFRPSTFHISLFKDGSFADVLNENTSDTVQLSMSRGTYILSVSVSWGSGGSTSNVFSVIIM
jgi:hypothetical protein